MCTDANMKFQSVHCRPFLPSFQKHSGCHFSTEKASSFSSRQQRTEVSVHSTVHFTQCTMLRVVQMYSEHAVPSVVCCADYSECCTVHIVVCCADVFWMCCTQCCADVLWTCCTQCCVLGRCTLNMLYTVLWVVQMYSECCTQCCAGVFWMLYYTQCCVLCRCILNMLYTALCRCTLKVLYTVLCCADVFLTCCTQCCVLCRCTLNKLYTELCFVQVYSEHAVHSVVCCADVL